MNDNKLIRTVLLILFLGLFFVYVIFFNIKKQKTNLTNISVDNPTIQTNPYNNIVSGLNINKQNDNIINSKSGFVINETNKKVSTNSTGEDLIPLPGFIDLKSNNTGILDINKQNLPNLSGTETFFGDIEVTKTLGLDYKYILKDKKGIYYVYMGTGVYDYEKNANLLGGDVFYLRTELDLLKNDLPGDLAIFINIPNITYIKTPQFKRQLVFLVLYFDKEQRILQIPYDIYHKNKKYIKKLFNEIY